MAVKMAADGKRLTDVNLLTRMFSFEVGACEATEYQITYDKSQSHCQQLLEESGWEIALSEGNWQFIKNDAEPIRAFPVREGILKRNRLHSNVLTVISFWYGFQLIMPLTFYCSF